MPAPSRKRQAQSQTRLNLCPIPKPSENTCSKQQQKSKLIMKLSSLRMSKQKLIQDQEKLLRQLIQLEEYFKNINITQRIPSYQLRHELDDPEYIVYANNQTVNPNVQDLMGFILGNHQGTILVTKHDFQPAQSQNSFPNQLKHTNYRNSESHRFRTVEKSYYKDILTQKQLLVLAQQEKDWQNCYQLNPAYLSSYLAQFHKILSQISR